MAKAMVTARYLSTLVLCSATLGICSAEVILDGTMGRAGELRGPDFQITEDLGQLHGSNLFHSFSEFNLSNRESATFSGSRGITNVISRVTGGNISSIDGIFNSTIAGANVYFINPNGVVFGPSATLNVGGSFYATSADYLALSDGGRFDVTNPRNTVLTSAAPSAFGFLVSNPASIDIDGAQLEIATGQDFGLVGGKINIYGPKGSLVDQYNDYNVYADSGRIDLIAVASAAEVAITSEGLRADAVPVLGSITLKDGAVLDASGDPGGTIYIRGGELFIIDSLMINGNEGVTDHSGRAFDIEVQNDLIIDYAAHRATPGTRVKGGIEAPVLNSGAGGDIHIVANVLSLEGNPSSPINSLSDPSFTGVLANISTESKTTASASGDGGDIDITAEQIYLLGNSRISTETFNKSNAGDIRINTQGLKLLGDQSTALINSASTTDFRRFERVAGHAGDISIVAEDIVLLGGAKGEVGLLSRAIHNVEQADAGDITIITNSLQVLDGAMIDAGRSGGTGGLGGAITINAGDVLVQGIDGSSRVSTIRAGLSGYLVDGVTGRDITITSDTLTLSDDGRIENINGSIGEPGHINIKAGEIDISRGGLIVTGAINPLGVVGAAGDVTIESDSIRIHSAISTRGALGNIVPDPRYPSLKNPTGIFVTAFPQSQKAGNISIKTNRLEVLDGGEINATTWSQNKGGDISIEAENVLVSGFNTTREVASRIISGSDAAPDASLASFAGGDGGDISITTQTLTLNDGAEITAFSSSPGNAGNIVINASDKILLTNGHITTNATQSTNGGNITVNAINMLHLTDSQINASVSGADGNGGNINIDPIFVILDGSAINANSVGGTGGNINIVAQHFIASPDSRISASSQTGLDGNVIVDAPDRDVSGELEAVPEPAPDAARYFRNDCVAVGGGYSSFTVAKAGLGRKRIGAMVPSHYVSTNQVSVTDTQAEQQQVESGKPLLVLSKNGTDCLGKRI